MKSIDRHLPRSQGRERRHGILSALVVAVSAAAVAALAAGCGGSGSTPDTMGQGGGATPIQILTQVQRGNLVQSVVGSVELVVSKGKTTVVAQIPQQSASSVAAGQAATLVFVTPRAGAVGGQSGAPMPQGGPSGAPVPQGGQSGAPFPQNGASGAPFPQGGLSGDTAPGRGTPGTVTSVKTNADGSVAVTIAVKKLPASATAKSVGFATIQTKVLAHDVIVIPTAAIKGSGSSATVQVLSGGKTSTRSVVVGQQAGAQSEIVSGLSVGENVVWTRSLPRGGFFGGSGSPFPGQSQQGSSGGTQ
jgi:hypothetical protein